MTHVGGGRRARRSDEGGSKGRKGTSDDLDLAGGPTKDKCEVGKQVWNGANSVEEEDR